MKLLILFLVIATIIKPKTQMKDNIKIPAIFSDNMVLQQKSLVTFWGKANPGVSVLIKAGWGKTANTKVTPDSTWKVKIETIKAGGPYIINLTVGDSDIVFKNVMLGEVWLCSGQSNMEMPLEGWPPQNPILNSAQEIKEANYPDIRMFTVSRAFSDKPEFNCEGSWNECNSKTASKFSATAYFFGRELFKELNVPIGLIAASWGGTKIQPWISAKYLEKLDRYKLFIKNLESQRGIIQKLNDWIYKHPVIDISNRNPLVKWKNLEFGDSACAEPDFNDSLWKEMNLPVYWESDSIGTFDGTVWFRKKIVIPKTWLNKDLVLEPGPIDDMDRSYVNGTLVGATEDDGLWETPRIYKVSKEIVKDTLLTIAIRVIDNQGGGGIWGNNVRMRIHPVDSDEYVAINGEWKYLPVAEFLNGKFYVYGIDNMEFYSRPKTSIDLGPNTPSMLYNGMIAPIIPYSIKGVIWYQGESNSDEPEDYNNYKTYLELMIKNWRANWKEGSFPFYFVQIAPYDYGKDTPSYMLRDAQRKTLKVKNTGMVVTLDIGNPQNIHPSDKQDVGKRLALWALAKDYGKDIVFSGPLYDSLEIKGDKAVLHFKYNGKGLKAKEGGLKNFLIAGDDKEFKEAKAIIDGENVIVSSPDVGKPLAVRYLWDNMSEATLFNIEGLPASSFRTDNW